MPQTFDRMRRAIDIRRDRRFARRLFPQIDRTTHPETFDWVLRRAAIEPSLAFYYQRVPKCANRTIVETLVTHIEYDRDPSQRFDHHQDYFRNVGRLRADTKQSRPAPLIDRTFGFTFVRHPEARVLSAYLDKVARDKPQAKFLADLGLTRDARPSFETFLDRLEQGHLHANSHWAPIVRLLPAPPADFAFIGRVETLTADLETLCTRLFGTFLGVHNRGSMTGAADKTATAITDVHRERIRRLYADDYAAFYPDT